MEKIAKDKKFTSGSIRFILLPHLGEACVSSDVSVDDLVEAIESLRIPIDCD
jgi:3-dehydroquinate synthase